MAYKPAESEDGLVGAGCERVDDGPTAEFGPAASFFGPEAWMPVEEEPSLACEGITWAVNRLIDEEGACTRQREARVRIKNCLMWRRSVVSTWASLEQC